MIRNMNQMAKSWVMRAFFAILIVAFVLIWGVSDVFQGGGLADHSLATVGNVKIGLGEFDKQTKLMAARLQQQGQQMNDAEIQSQVLQMLITNALLDQEADQLGLAISDAQIARIIKEAPTFHDRSGQFSKQIFEAVAQSEHLSPKGLEEELRKEARRNQLLQLASSGLTVPASYVSMLFKWQHQKRTIDYAIIQPSSFTNLPVPTEDAMKSYYDEHHDQFTSPEQRDVSVILFSESAVRSKIKLSPEEIQAGMALKRDSNDKGGLPTKAETDRIMEELKAEKSMDEFNRLTTAIEDSMAGGMTLEELAKSHGLELMKIDGLKRSGLSSSKNNLKPEYLIEVVDQAFKQEPGETPFLSQIGSGDYLATRVDKVHAAKLIPFEEAQKDVSTVLKHEAQVNAAKELAEAMVKSINEGGQLAALAKEHKLALKTGVAIDRLDSSDKALPMGLRAVGFATELNKAGVAPAEKGSLAVIVPKTITEPKTEEIKDEQLQVFRTNLERNMGNDMLMQYLESLQKRYRVDVNRAVLDKLQQKV